jgi:hypothetical protein
MATISPENKVFTVMVRTRMVMFLQDQFVELVQRQVMPAMAALPGFISHTLHKSHDGTEVLNYLQWRSEADHAHCFSNPMWEVWADEVAMFLQTHRLPQEVMTYEVVASREAPQTG